jgi:effector-binding domain-containing protein
MSMTVDQIPIGRFSVVTRLSLKALRYYDEKGILTPKAKDPFTGYRYYTGDQIAVGVKISTLTTLGFSLEETVSILEAEERGETMEIEESLRARLSETRAEINRLEGIAALLSNGKGEMLKMTLTEPVVKETPALRVISKRAKGEYGPTIGRLIGELMQCLYSPDNQRSFVKMVGPIMTIYHDHEYKEEEADLEVAVPVSGRVTVTDSLIEIRNLSPQRVISLIHKGPYETIGQAYSRLNEYITKNGLEYAGPMMDLYLNDPNKVPKDEVMTEIQAPIKG